MAEEGNPQAWQRRARDVPIIMRVARVSVATPGTAITAYRLRSCGLHSAGLCRLICFAHKRNFMRRPATNWHDGQISENLSSSLRKNIPLSFSPKSVA